MSTTTSPENCSCRASAVSCKLPAVGKHAANLGRRPKHQLQVVQHPRRRQRRWQPLGAGFLHLLAIPLQAQRGLARRQQGQAHFARHRLPAARRVTVGGPVPRTAIAAAPTTARPKLAGDRRNKGTAATAAGAACGVPAQAARASASRVTISGISRRTPAPARQGDAWTRRHRDWTCPRRSRQGSRRSSRGFPCWAPGGK